MKKKISLAFFGDFPFSLAHLKAIHADSRFSIEIVVTSKNSAGFVNHVHNWSEEQLGPDRTVSFSKKDLILSKLSKCDILLSAGFTRKIPEELFSTPKTGINIHPSYLPLLRGPDPIRTALLDGIDSFGVTYHRLTENFDEGDIFWQQKYSPENKECTTQILCELQTISIESVGATLEAIHNRSLLPKPQSECTHYARTATDGDRKLLPSQTMATALGQLRAFSPEKPCFYHGSKETLHVVLAGHEKIEFIDGSLEVSVLKDPTSLSPE